MKKAKKKTVKKIKKSELKKVKGGATATKLPVEQNQSAVKLPNR